MRQLLAEGWMHNRLRMATASYLTKNLLIDWREGEAHFMRHLLDGDESQNNGNWQWAASVGADPQPYFRVFNPIRQQSAVRPRRDATCAAGSPRSGTYRMSISRLRGRRRPRSRNGPDASSEATIRARSSTSWSRVRRRSRAFETRRDDPVPPGPEVHTLSGRAVSNAPTSS